MGLGGVGLGGCGTMSGGRGGVGGWYRTAVGLDLQQPGFGLLLVASVSVRRRGQAAVPVPCSSLLVSHRVGITLAQPQFYPFMLLCIY